MKNGSHIPRTHEEAARLLARWHRESEPSIAQIFWHHDPATGEIRLIEVNPKTIPTGEAMVFGFAPSGPFPFRSAVAEVTPDEWAQILGGRIPLPSGWRSTDFKPIEP